MVVKQLTVFIENREGRMCDVLEILKNNDMFDFGDRSNNLHQKKYLHLIQYQKIHLKIVH